MTVVKSKLSVGKTKIAITDANVQKWMTQLYSEAKNQTFETLPEFERRLFQDYEYDYATICVALAAYSIAALRAAEQMVEGGITESQSDLITIEFLRNYGTAAPSGLRLRKNDLYPLGV
jgi:hypothetical protein